MNRGTSVLLASLFFSTLLNAETRYVTDQFKAPLRTGQTNAYRIRAEISSGTAVELLDSNSETGYSHIKTRRGTEGWILTRYLTDQPVARDQLKALKQKLSQSESAQKALTEEKNLLLKSSQLAKEDNQTLTELNSKLVDELSYIKQISGNAVNINQRNQELIEENQQLQNQVELLSAENDRLKEEKQQNFFLYGAGTILVGVILGLAMPAIRPRKKDPGWV